MCLLVFLNTFAAINDAEAACTGASLPAGTAVTIEACDDAQVTSNQGQITIPVPAGTIASGDMLLTIIATDDVRTFTTPAGWELVIQGVTDTNSLAVLKRISGGTEPANYAFGWSGNSQAYGHMLHITGANGTITAAETSPNGNDSTPPAPAITAGTAGDMIIRIAGVDQTDGTGGAVPAGHTEITRRASGGGNNQSSRGYSAFLVSSGGGTIPAINWTTGSNEEAVTVSLSIAQGVATPTPTPQACPQIDGTATGSQLVVFEQCTVFKDSGNDDDITLDLPSSAQAGDFLVAVINTDANELPFTVVPGGWTSVAEQEGSGITTAVYSKVVTQTEEDNVGTTSYFWDLNSNEQRYAYLMLFRGASGQIVLPAPVFPAIANSATPTTPGITTAVDNSLVVRLVTSEDGQVDITALETVAGYNNIAADNTTNSTAGVGAQAVYLNQVTAAGAPASDAVNFSLEASREARRTTLGIEPIEFRFSTADGASGTSSICTLEQITLSVTDKNGTLMPWFEGEVTISASNSTGASWSYSGAGLSDTGNGGATYQFQVSDGGSVTLDYYNPNEGAVVDFSVSYNSGTVVFSESTTSGYTPASLTITDCQFVVTYEAGNQVGTCGVEAVTIALEDLAGNPAVQYSGTITVDNGGGSFGSYALNTGIGANFNDATANDGQATYTFAITPSGGESNEVILDYTHGSISLTAVDFSVTSSTLGIAEAASNGNLAIVGCEIRISYTGVTVGSNSLSDTCSPTEMRVQVVDETGTPISGYTGTILITNDQSIGTYAQAGAVNVPNNSIGGSTSNGQASYTFAASENGDAIFDFSVASDVIPNIDFQIVETSTPNVYLPPSGIYDADVDILPCTIDIQSPAVYGVCDDGVSITFSIRDRSGALIPNYDGAIDIETDSMFGDYSFVSGGSGISGLANGTSNDGEATYTFSGTNSGQVVLEFTSSEVEDIEFSASSAGPLGLAIDAGSARDLEVAECEVRISVAAGPIDVCSIIEVTFTITDTAGSPITGFGGSIELKAESDVGNWFAQGSTPGTLDNTDGGTDNGRASYSFNGTEVGAAVTLDFRHPTVNGAVSFDASDDLDSVSTLNVSTAGGQDPSINVQGCTVVVSTPDTALGDVNQANVCSAGERVVFTVTNSQATTATDFNGLIVLRGNGLLGDEGNFSSPSGAPSASLGGYGTLDNGTGNDGIATYQFDASGGDQGIVEAIYSTGTADQVTFSGSTTGITSAGTDNVLTFNDCIVQISFPSDTAPFQTDVCSIKQVQLQVVGYNSVVVDDYTGNIAISTSTSFGTWAISAGGAEGSLSNGTVGNGGASYTFVDDGPGGSADDDGVILLDFLHAGDNATAVNINVTGSNVSDPGNPGSTFDPNLFVDECTFQISFEGGGLADAHNDFTKTACSQQEVTIEVYKSAVTGGGLATDYSGTVQLSTSSNNGNWSDATVSVTDTGGDDDGLATVVFNSTGSVTIDFVNLNTETMTVGAVDLVNGLQGAITVDGAANPTLEITSCSPTIVQQSCAAGTDNFADIAIGARDTNTSLQGRMVLMALTWEGDDAITSAQFNTTSIGDNFNQAMIEVISEILDAGAFDSRTYLYGILDADLPALADTYRASYTKPGTNSVGMCLLYLEDVEQSFPVQTVSGTANDNDPVNTSSATNTQVASTTITTQQNNAFVVSVIGNGQGTNQDTVSYDQVSPTPPMTQLFVQNDPPISADFAISTGVSASAGLFTVDETYDSVGDTIPNRHTHLVASFNPIITGPPVPVGYVPVTLFETYSGDISYVAIGATLRSGSNPDPAVAVGPGNPDLSCSFVNDRASTLTLPEIDERDTGTYPGIVDFGASGVDDQDSTVLDAYLYWMASGDQALPVAGGTGFNEVKFVVPGGSAAGTSVTADEVFLIDNVGGNSSDYYAAYKRVTDLMPTPPNGTYNVLDIDFDNGSPWDIGEGCGAGWALVVVYANPYEEFRVVNLFHGFQPFQNSAFTLVPRNFRMAKDEFGTERPNGLVTHVTLEGDETLETGDESLKIQDEPGGTDASQYFVLDTPFNPPGTEFNGTVTRPVFQLVDTDPTAAVNYKYQWDSTASNGTNRSGGYEIDFPGPVFPPSSAALSENGGSWGLDVDTHYISGDQEAAEGSDLNVLFDFADQQTEEITTRYSSGQDLVLLVHEAISVENAPIADIEVTVTEGASSTFKVGSTGNTYEIVVKNNGNGASSFGAANGTILLVGEFPTGMTLTGLVGTGWSCSTSSNAFTCTQDVTNFGATALNTLTATVSIVAPDAGSPPVAFPSLTNNATVVTRVAHVNDDQSGFSCNTGLTIGELPDPDNCNAAGEFDNVNDLQGGIVDINDLDQKTGNNNNVDSVETQVKGIETELQVVKGIVSLLEKDGLVVANLYTLTVTNNGPDAFVYSAGNREIKIVDDEPSGINFSAATGTDWSCSITSGSPDQLGCDFTGSLGVGASTVITVSGIVTGNSGDLVSNTATVSTGLYNFDQVGTNNSSTNNTNITDPVANATDRFLLSVSSGGLSSIGDGTGALNFDDNDLIIYDPVQDSAVSYLDNDALGYNLDDPNAVHLLPNGKVVLSTANASSMGANNLSFEVNDLVLWDPITGQASLFFDQSAADASDVLDGQNIDAVYVLDGGSSGDFIFSTTDDVSDGVGGNLDWEDGDLIFYDASTDTFSVYLNGNDASVFDTGAADIDALYLNTNETNPFSTPKDEFVLSSDNQNTVIGDDNSTFGQDDVVEFIPTGRPDPTSSTSETIFRGNVPIGVFSTPSGMDVDTVRKLNALHVLESGYIGHFQIIQSQAGTACTAGEIRIVKHLNSASGGHPVDTDYTGSIEITADTVGSADIGTWTIVSGNGTLDNSLGGTNNGQAIYTFVGSDNGDITLSLNVTEDPPVARSIDVNVTNRLVSELGSEDDDFDFNLSVSSVTFRDEVSAIAYNNSDGVAAWAGPWVEVDDTGSGPSSGKVNANGGKLNLTATPASATVPSLTREANLEPFRVTETTFLNFDYTYSSANASDEIEVYVTVDGTLLGGGALATYTGLSGTNNTPTAVSLDLSTLAPEIDVDPGAGVDLQKFTGTTEIEFRVASGYTSGGVFSIDNVEIATGTTDCNFGAFDHFKIVVANEIGLACVVSQVTIIGHDAGHTELAPGVGTAIDLTTSTGAGTWPSIASGAGSLVETSTAIDGQATFTFAADQSQVTLNFNYTNPDTGSDNSPVGDNPVVNFNISGLVSGIAKTELQDPNSDSVHDPSITFDEVGLIFSTGGNLDTSSPTPIPFQIAGKPSTTAPVSNSTLPTVQLVRSVLRAGNEASACSPLVSDGTRVNIKLAAVCENPGTCSAGVTQLPFTNDASPTPAVVQVPIFNTGAQADPSGAGVDVELLFENTGTTVDGSENIAATLDFTYPDAGKIRFYGQYEIPFNNDASAPTILSATSGGLAKGSSNQFIVRPFGFDIDFSGDRRADTNQSNDISRAADADGPAFARAGVGFSTTVSAVAWQAGDDADEDGNPGFGIDLSNNPITPNFGNETGLTNDPTVLVSVAAVDGASAANPGVPSGVLGTISSGAVFDGFANGVSTHDMAIDEVGIFDLNALLIQNNGNQTAVNYFEETASQGVVGGTVDVGRLYPAYFELVSSSFENRVNQSCSMSPKQSSSFTYMGEDFGVNFVLQAKNALNNPTKNYFGSFAKLATRDALNFRAILAGVATNSNVSSRLVFDGTFSSITDTSVTGWTSDVGSAAANASGSLTIGGNIRFSRKPTAIIGSEDGPFTNVEIAFAPLDENGDVGVTSNDVQIGSGFSSGVTTSIFDVDIDNDTTNVLKLINGATTQFRYGRMRLEDSFGSETEPLGIGVLVEYWDGSQFVLNDLDSCTAINFDVSDKSFTVVPDSAVPEEFVTVPAEQLDEADVVIESGTVADFSVTLNGGRTNANDINGTDVLVDPDRPISAGPTTGEKVGSVIVEFDLGDADTGDASKTLDFLSYDWRTETGTPDLYDEISQGTDNNYNDNPRAILNFGSYRGHDRVINWQEIYIGPN